MKFRFYILDTFEGMYIGTNDKDVAKNYAESEDFFVVDAESSEMLEPGGERRAVSPDSE